MKPGIPILAILTLATPSIAAPLPNCDSMDLKTAPPGFRCATDANRIIQRVQLPGFPIAWKSSDGLTWGFNLTTKELDYPTAERACKAVGARLPTAREVFGTGMYPRIAGFPCGAASDELDFNEGRCYWTSDNHVADPADAPGAAKILYCCRRVDLDEGGRVFNIESHWQYWMYPQSVTCVH